MCASDGDRCISSERPLFPWTRQWKNINWSSFKIVLRNGFRGVAVFFACILFSTKLHQLVKFQNCFKKQISRCCSTFCLDPVLGKVEFWQIDFFCSRQLFAEDSWEIVRWKTMIDFQRTENCPQNGVSGISWIPKLLHQMRLFFAWAAFSDEFFLSADCIPRQITPNYELSGLILAQRSHAMQLCPDLLFKSLLR